MNQMLEGWLKKNCHQKSLAIILGGSVNGLSFARSLGRRGIPTLILDSEAFLGTFTRYGKVLLLPAVEEHAEDWLTLLKFVASQLDRPAVLFATSDAHCLWVSRHTKVLRQYFRFIIPDTEAVEQIVNKRSQYMIARAAGIPVPNTWFPESLEEVGDLAPNLVYPCLLKPYTSYKGRRKLSKKKVLIVASQKELLSEYERLTADNLLFMIQEIIPGEDTALYGYLGFWDGEGLEHSWLTKKKLRQLPPDFGDGSLQITIEAPEVAELSRRLLRAFNYKGFVNIEFKYDARDHTCRLIEINPRSAASNQMAISAGIDFPWIGYQYLTASDPKTVPTVPFRSLVKCVNEEWEIQAYFAYRKAGALNLWSWLRSLNGAKITIMAWDDPLPFIVGFWRLVKVFWCFVWSMGRKPVAEK
jgi:D-aspartate ligase